MNITSYIPLLRSLKGYKRSQVANDLRAGFTVGVILIPQAMAYAMLAGVPPIYGLYAGLLPLILYAFLGTSRQLSVGPVAVSSLLVLAGVSAIANPGSAEYIALVITAGLFIGIFQLLLGVFKFGFIANFLSHPVLAGFISAAAIIICVSQLKDVLGLEIPAISNAFNTCYYAVCHVQDFHGLTIIISGIALAILMAMKRYWATFPTALLIVVLGTLGSYIFRWDQMGLDIIGSVPKGLPAFQLPDLTFATFTSLIPTILTVSIMGIVECISIAKSLEAKNKGQDLDPNKELIAIGWSKIAGSFFQALPSSASFSRSAINNNFKAHSQLSSLFTVLLVVLSLLFFTPLFYYLPKAILAAIIFQSVIGLFDYKEAINLWKTHKTDLLMMLVTFFITLFWGIEEGVSTGVILSLLMVLYQSSKPQISILGSVPGTTFYRNIERFEDIERVADTLILRFENQLYFGNADFFKDQIRALISSSEVPFKHVVLDATAINNIDSSGVRALRSIDDELKEQGIDLYLAGTRGVVRDILAISGLMNEPDKHHNHVHGAVQYILTNTISAESHRAIQANKK